MNTCRRLLWQLTQPDVNAGQVSNTATATSTAGNGERLHESSTWVTPLERDARIEIGEALATVKHPSVNRHIQRAYHVVAVLHLTPRLHVGAGVGI